MQFNLKSLLIAVALMLICCRCLEQISGHVRPRAVLRQLATGMPEARVREILGDPQEARRGVWVYTRFANPGWIEIHFDDGVIRSINDESVNP